MGSFNTPYPPLDIIATVLERSTAAGDDEWWELSSMGSQAPVLRSRVASAARKLIVPSENLLLNTIPPPILLSLFLSPFLNTTPFPSYNHFIFHNGFHRLCF
jgi:hypothetical protein